tara:strand:+ start:24 stop:1208 length:1185 start_codon:yes stop_codon:yes gene_type:complete
MSSNLKVNNILPSTGTTVAVSGIASVTSSVSIASSCTATTFYGGLDTNGGNIAFGDSSSNSDDVLTFGTGNDLQLHSDGTNGVLRQNNNSGGLYIQADNFVQIGKVNAGSPIYGKFIKDGAVELYHNGSKRFETTTGGNKSIKSSANTFVIGSSDAGGAHLTLDGDSNGDGSGADYCGISHNTDGNMVIYQDNPNGNGQIDFQTGGANRVSMQSDKLRPWNNEGMTLGTSGLRWGDVFTSGINFAHTSDASGMSNELLDDYEEGSWNPDLQLSNGTSIVSSFAWRTGKYTKVGNLVHCTFAMGLSSINSGNTIRLGGIPFAPAGITYFYYFILHGYSYLSGFGDSGNTTRLFGEIGASFGSQISIVKGSGRNTANSSDIGSGQRFTGMFHYYTA